MLSLLLIALLTAVAAGALTALWALRRRLQHLHRETERLRASLTRKRPAGISLQQANLSSRMEDFRASALALTREVAPHARVEAPEDCVLFLRQVYQDQRRANAEYEARFARTHEELTNTRRRLEETRTSLQQLRIRRGTSEAQLAELEAALASVMAERDQLRWRLRRLEPQGMKKAG